MTTLHTYLETYTALSKAYISVQTEQSLAQASQLGRQLVEDNISLEHVAEIHERAVALLRQNSSQDQLLSLLDHVHTPFMELLMAYGMASRAKDDRIYQDQINLQEAHTRIKCIIDQAGEAIISLDAKNHISMFNGMAVIMFGYSEEEVIGQPIHILFPKATQRYYDNMIQQFRKASTHTQWIVKHGESNFVHHNGTEFPVQVSLSKATVKNEQIMTLMITDVTEQKQSQDALEQLNVTLESRVKQRTTELEEINHNLQETLSQLSQSNMELSLAQKALVKQAHAAGMSEIATNVLHNVGNVLNSVNLSAQVLLSRLNETQVIDLSMAVDLMQQHCDDLGEYLMQDDQGKLLPKFLTQLSKRLSQDQQGCLEEMRNLMKHVEHIKQVVVAQQSIAKVGGLWTTNIMEELANEALQINHAAFERQHIIIETQYQPVPSILTDKQKVLQILVNLISNAQQATINSSNKEQKVILRIEQVHDTHVRFVIIDNGTGIDHEHLPRIFQHGFTTKKDGHGFGLHSAVIAAKELGGSLTAQSEGRGKGATFTLELPIQQQEGEKNVQIVRS